LIRADLTNIYLECHMYRKIKEAFWRMSPSVSISVLL
jgi:hypothetical protein